jgi:hypothetical protein
MRQRIWKPGGDFRFFNAGPGVTVEFRLRLQGTPLAAEKLPALND